MEHTKAWIVKRSSMGMWNYAIPLGLFFSEQEAEFFKWLKNKASDSWNYYTIEVVPVLAQEKKGKEYEKFKAEKLAEIEKAILEKNTHSSEDLAEVERLQKEKEALQA